MIDANVLIMPVFLGLIAAEYGLGRLRGKRLYAWGGLFDDLASSVSHITLLAVLGATTFTLYEWLRASVAVMDFPTEPAWAWLVVWVLSDFCWYWRHRFGHHVAVGWAIHEVHHQSPDMNLAVGLRVGVLQFAQTLPFMLPMALLGVPMWMFAAVFGAAHLYQTLLHTTLIDRVPLIDVFLTMPADHRVHHGKNARYRDTNFGHNLIIWDRLFGTYAVESASDPVVYGIDRPLAQWNPIRNNIDPWLELFGRRPEPGPAAVASTAPRQRILATAWFAGALVAAAALLQTGSDLTWWMRCLVGLWVMWAFAQAGRTLTARASSQMATASGIGLGVSALVLMVMT